ncbi:faciogenital dysplasia protein [Anaeramoeba ignava]|uniref:Faciogenital dysplasia protein n=1 Tax=Anaeramoeba ignava TaxID=1746090 RepID=A0A9Q0LKS3_ANAIG|nr:faciogenital dysplasia protein [Anaeramoeba ignava]
MIMIMLLRGTKSYFIKKNKIKTKNYNKIIIFQKKKRNLHLQQKLQHQNSTKRKEITLELFQTENSYIKFLDILINKIMNPLQSEGIISEKERKLIFDGLDVIFAYQKEFHKELEPVIKEWNIKTCIGELIIRKISYFRSYISYINNYENSIQCVANLRKKNRRFREFLNESQTQNQNLSIESLLIMPIQRLPRYVLLLEDLFKNTPKNHPDYEHLKKALTEMKATTTKLNDEKSEREKQEKVIEIATKITEHSKSKLGLQIIDPARRLIYTDKFQLNFEQKLFPYQIFIFSDSLLLCQLKKPRFTLKQQVEESKYRLSAKSFIHFSNDIEIHKYIGKEEFSPITVTRRKSKTEQKKSSNVDNISNSNSPLLSLQRDQNVYFFIKISFLNDLNFFVFIAQNQTQRDQFLDKILSQISIFREATKTLKQQFHLQSSILNVKIGIPKIN